MSISKTFIASAFVVATTTGAGFAHDYKHAHTQSAPVGASPWNCVNESSGPLPSGCDSNLYQPRGAVHNPTIVYVTGTSRRAGRQEFHWQQKK